MIDSSRCMSSPVSPMPLSLTTSWSLPARGHDLDRAGQAGLELGAGRDGVAGVLHQLAQVHPLLL